MTVGGGLPEYSEAHIPGAGFIDQLTQLSVVDSPLRFTLPPIAELTAAFAQAGISESNQVVFYSSGHFMWATRAWWLLRYCGHNQVSVLDGGLAAWEEAGLATEVSQKVYAINALSKDVYNGTAKIHYGRPGHIPGSNNLPFSDLLQFPEKQPKVKREIPLQTLLAPAPLQEQLQQQQLLGPKPLVTYCGGGIRCRL